MFISFNFHKFNHNNNFNIKNRNIKNRNIKHRIWFIFLNKQNHINLNSMFKELFAIIAIIIFALIILFMLEMYIISF